METKSLGENWRDVQQALAAAGIEQARLEARFLVEHVTGCQYRDLLASPESMVPVERQFMLDMLLARRLAGEPMAYLLGECDFRGRPFQVSPGVLIPRSDTEVLVELALQRLAPLPAATVLDLGTGSGIVAISLALECPTAQVQAVDLSEAALAVARNNASRLRASVAFRQSDWFSALNGEKFDLIVSNPPYVAEGDPHLALNGLPFEPRMALTDQVENGDGLACIRQIVADAADHLNSGGWLLFEHGYDQGLASRNLLTATGFKAVFTHPDLAGIDRVSGGHI